jgi:O-antigen ligase
VTPAARLVALAAGGLVAARCVVGDHTPSVDDALFAAGFAVLALVVAKGPGPRASLWVAAGLLGVAAVGVLASWHPLISIAATPVLLGPAAAFVAVCAGGPALRPALLGGLAAGGALNAITAWTQKLVLWPDALARAKELGLKAREIAQLQHGRPHGLSFSPDLMAALCLAGAVAATALAAGAARRESRAAFVALALLATSGVAASRSAGAALALGLFLAVLVVLRLHALRGARVALAGALVGAALPVLSILALGRGRAIFTSAGERVWNWQIGLEAFGAHPILGVGLARFPAAYAAHRVPEANMTRYAHSTPVHTLVEVGGVGGGVLCALLLAWLFLTLRARARSAGEGVDDILLAGALALFARTLFDYDGQVAQTATSLAVVAGLAFAAHRRPEQSATVSPALLRGVMGVLLAVCLAAGAWQLSRERALAPFERLAKRAPTDVKRLRAHTDAHPGDVVAQALVARTLRVRLLRCKSDCDALREEARAFVEAQAPSEHPAPDLFVLAAEVAAAEGDLVRARSETERALALEPGHARAWRTRVRIARKAGHPDAEDLAAQAARWREKTGR